MAADAALRALINAINYLFCLHGKFVITLLAAEPSLFLDSVKATQVVETVLIALFSHPLFAEFCFCVVGASCFLGSASAAFAFAGGQIAGLHYFCITAIASAVPSGLPAGTTGRTTQNAKPPKTLSSEILNGHDCN